eukprot:1339667-Amorphochlora_amoeboformis.AAC.1
MRGSTLVVHDLFDNGFENVDLVGLGRFGKALLIIVVDHFQKKNANLASLRQIDVLPCHAEN